MIDDKFIDIMQSNTGCAVVLAGSDSDKPHIDEVVKSLKAYQIPYEVRICSAHKQPGKLQSIMDEYNAVGGLVAYITIAGGPDALSGTASFHALGPVISCPPDHPNQSCLSNPLGSSNAYIGKPSNVGKFIAQMYAGFNPQFRALLETNNAAKIGDLEVADTKFRADYANGV